jgi:hypothetical protein
MGSHNRSSYAEAIKYAVGETLVRENEITVTELAKILADRADELSE